MSRAPTTDHPDHPDDPGRRDELALLRLFTEATERLNDETDLDRLWERVLSEAAALIPTATTPTTAVLRWHRRRWIVFAPIAPESAGATLLVEDRGGRPQTPARHTAAEKLTDSRSALSLVPPTPAFDERWRSVLLAKLDCFPSRRPTQLAWLSPDESAFATHHDLAAMYARHAGQAVRNATTRHTLAQAVEAHHRVGQAQGILMARYGLTASGAFALLKRQSQNTNVKLRAIADQIITSGDLDPRYHKISKHVIPEPSLPRRSLPGPPPPRPSRLGPPMHEDRAMEGAEPST